LEGMIFSGTREGWGVAPFHVLLTLFAYLDLLHSRMGMSSCSFVHSRVVPSSHSDGVWFVFGAGGHGHVTVMHWILLFMYQ
jgi:hypothetical protein